MSSELVQLIDAVLKYDRGLRRVGPYVDLNTPPTPVSGLVIGWFALKRTVEPDYLEDPDKPLLIPVGETWQARIELFANVPPQGVYIDLSSDNQSVPVQRQYFPPPNSGPGNVVYFNSLPTQLVSPVTSKAIVTASLNGRSMARKIWVYSHMGTGGN